MSRTLWRTAAALLVTLAAYLQLMGAHGRALPHGRALAQASGGGGRPGPDDTGGTTPPSAVNATANEELLLAFKASLDNGEEILTNWRAGSDPCAWAGISCGAAGEVQSM